MMDIETLETFRHLGVREPNGAGQSIPAGLRAAEVDMLSLLREQDGLRLEQERVNVAHTLEKVHGLLRDGTSGWAAGGAR